MAIISTFDSCHPLDRIDREKWTISYTVRDDVELRNKIDNVFEREITPLTKSYGELILNMMKVMTDDQLCQLIADSSDLIRFIINPTGEMQYIAIMDNADNYTYIGNISEYNALLVIKKTDGRAFSELSQNIQTESMIKLMKTKYSENLNYKDIIYEMRERASLKTIMDELQLNQLENI